MAHALPSLAGIVSNEMIRRRQQKKGKIYVLIKEKQKKRNGKIKKTASSHIDPFIFYLFSCFHAIGCTARFNTNIKINFLFSMLSFIFQCYFHFVLIHTYCSQSYGNFPFYFSYYEWFFYFFFVIPKNCLEWVWVYCMLFAFYMKRSFSRDENNVNNIFIFMMRENRIKSKNAINENESFFSSLLQLLYVPLMADGSCCYCCFCYSATVRLQCSADM